MQEWRDIPSYEGLYEASSEGQIRTKEGKTTSSARFKKRVWKQRILKQKFKVTGKRRDALICLWKDGKPHYHTVARLIATTFHENLINSDFTVNHIDGNTLNNRADNLEWLTLADNIKYGFQNGQYASFMKAITAVSTINKEKILCARSYAEMDRILGQYKGYTSRTVCSQCEILHNKSGEKYRITTF